MYKKYQKKRTGENINKWAYNSILSLGSHSKADKRNNHQATGWDQWPVGIR